MKDGKSLMLAILFPFWHLSKLRHEVICHYKKIPTSLCCQDFLWQNHQKISLQWYHGSGRMVPIPNIRYTRCQRASWWVCYKVPWVSVIFLLLDLSSTICTLSAFGFVVNIYYSTTALFWQYAIFIKKLHKSCYNIYKYSSLMLPTIIFAD